MELPVGPSVAFLFTDIEGSTRLERAAGALAWAAIVARHDDLLRAAIEQAGGAVVKTEGDAFFAAFENPAGAAAAAVAAQRAVASEGWPQGTTIRLRMGLHVGEGRLRQGGPAGAPEDYVGIDVNYAARITAVGNGGQIVLSDPFAAAVGPGLAAIPGLDNTWISDEGLRVVKDFDEPAALHRLVVPGAADDRRRLRTIEAPSNLPGEVTALVGRDGEIEHLVAIVTANRIVTLAGPGGSGKTRLALGVARAMTDQFPHGVWFVDLAGLRDPALLDSAVAATLAVGDSPDRTVGQALHDYLRDRTALLVLDNLEQLLPEAANVVSELARGAPRIRFLITSRELLRISGERGYPVPPLDMGDCIALFEDRALAQRADLNLGDESRATVQAICERLGGLPLAIELAAARVRSLSPTQILDRVGHSLDMAGGPRDVPERQRTLRGAITWSYELLSDEERRLFRRLAVFAGGWTLDAAQQVIDPNGSAPGGSIVALGIDLGDGLESLADKSLVRDEPAGQAADGANDALRFGLHPLLREYALERLEESGERPTIEARHAAVIATIAEAAGVTILGPGVTVALDRLDHEGYNIQAAITWSLAHDEPSIGLRIIGSAWRWFQQRGRLREGRGMLGELLARSGGVELDVRILALAAEGGLAYWMADTDAARAAYEERLELALGTGDPGLIADAHYDLGFLSMMAQDGPGLLEHEQRALDLYLEAGRPEGVVRAHQGLVLGLFLSGEYERARVLEEENRTAMNEAGSPLEVADSELLLAAIYFRGGDPTTAWARLVDGLRFFAAHDVAPGLARALGMAAILQLEQGDAELGARVGGAALDIVREKGVMLAPVKVLHMPDPGDLAVERFGPERAALLLSEGAATARPEIVAAVLAASPPAAPR